MVSPSASPSNTTDTSLPMNTILHMITIKLSSTNYLLWRHQIEPLLAYQSLTAYVDGSLPAPPATITAENDITAPNPAYLQWQQADQRARIILQSSLTEESMAIVLGLTSAPAVWSALETYYSHDSIDRMHTLRDSLRQLQKGTSTVVEFSTKFKGFCDKLSAIDHPVNEIDKYHWFLCGLGSGFETFSTTQRALTPRSSFRNLVSQAESHELFLTSVQPQVSTQAAFNANTFFTSRGRGRGNGSRGRGRGRGNSGFRRIPHCQLCRKDGHYASSCPDLASFATHSPSLDANLAQAFHAGCNISPNSPDWYVDSGATSHMTASPSHLDTLHSYSEPTNKGSSSNGKTQS